MSSIDIPSTILNTENKGDFPEIILGEQIGLIDSINKFYPRIWSLYKTMKNQDWDENDFVYSSCNAQFKSCEPHVYDMMIKTLAWQWEADTVASRIFISTLSGVCTSSEAWAGWQRISDNEMVHALTYSEIVRNSFDNPNEILEDILSVQESLQRLEFVSNIFHEADVASKRYVLGDIENSQELYNTIYKFIVGILLMERIQFMASFAITFGLVDSTGLFQPIGKAVQKIAQDEFEIHVPYGKEVLRCLYLTDRGKKAYEQTRDEIIHMINEVVESEVLWTEFAFDDGRELTGITKEMILDWVYFGGTDVAKFLGVEKDVNFKLVETNPLKYMESWVDMSQMQASMQEEDTGQYKVNVVQRDDEDEVFDF